MLFQSYAKRNPNAWYWLIDQRLHHTKFGWGKTKRFENPDNPIIWVEFEEPCENKKERCFAGTALNGVMFDVLWLSQEKIDTILAYENKRIEEEKLIASQATIPSSKIVKQNTAPSIAQSKPEPINRKYQLVEPPGLIKCPYCVFSYSKDVLPYHISRAHPRESKKHPVYFPIPEKRETEKEKSAVYYQCPYCPSGVKDKKFAKHIRRVHPGQPIPEKPQIYRNSKTVNGLKKKKRKKPNTKGVIQQITMRTINVRRSRGAVIRRRSY